MWSKMKAYKICTWICSREGRWWRAWICSGRKCNGVVIIWGHEENVTKKYWEVEEASNKGVKEVEKDYEVLHNVNYVVLNIPNMGVVYNHFNDVGGMHMDYNPNELYCI